VMVSLTFFFELRMRRQLIFELWNLSGLDFQLKPCGLKGTEEGKPKPICLPTNVPIGFGFPNLPKMMSSPYGTST
jgi:hypothetical protein